MGFPTHGTTWTHVIQWDRRTCSLIGYSVIPTSQPDAVFRGLGLVLRDADGTLQKEEGAGASGGTAEPTVWVSCVFSAWFIAFIYIYVLKCDEMIAKVAVFGEITTILGGALFLFFPLPRGFFFPDHPFTMKPAGKQASKQATEPTEQPSKAASDRASTQAGRPASQASPSQPSQPTSKQASQPASKGVRGQASKPAMHVARAGTALHAGKQASKAASKQLRKQARK